MLATPLAAHGGAAAHSHQVQRSGTSNCNSLGVEDVSLAAERLIGPARLLHAADQQLDSVRHQNMIDLNVVAPAR